MLLVIYKGQMQSSSHKVGHIITTPFRTIFFGKIRKKLTIKAQYVAPSDYFLNNNQNGHKSSA